MTPRPSPPSRYKATKKQHKAGGYGSVEIWHDDLLDRNVAIKWLYSQDGEEQLLNEWRVLANTASRHIVEIYDLIFDRHGVLFGIVMEYVDGNTLSDIAVPSNKEESISLVRLLYQLSIGLADLHCANIVHRDVKPENAVIDQTGWLKVCDFGLSSPSGMPTTRVRATMGYCAPELFSRPAIVTIKSDVYSFGAVCWRLFTKGFPNVGRLGIPDRSKFPLKSIGTVVKMPSRLAKIIDDCLSWNPDERPDIGTVSSALRAELVKGKHAASVSLGAGPVIIDSTTPDKRFSAGNNTIRVAYDGYDFSVREVSGDVYINNSRAHVDSLLTEGCLLTFGDASLGAARGFAPFRQFVPEVVI